MSDPNVMRDALTARMAAANLRPNGINIIERLRAMTPDEKESIRRLLCGEADEDRIRRGDVIEVIRDLRVSPASLASSDYQAALRDVQKAIGLITPESAA